MQTTYTDGNVSKITCKWFQMGKKLSKFNEIFIRNYDEKVITDIFSK